MTEIRIDTGYPHPPERVWRAVTDPRVLREWFMETAITARSEGVPRDFTLTPDGDDGFDAPVTGEVTQVECGRVLRMVWRSTELHTQVTLVVVPKDSGCRLSFVQRGFLGQQGALRRRTLQRTYREMFGGNLRAALKRLEADDRERGRDNLLRRGADAPGRSGGGAWGQWSSGQPAAGRNETRLFSAAQRPGSRGWRRLRSAEPRSASADTRGSWGARDRSPAMGRGVAPPAGEALSDSLTAPMARRQGSSRAEGSTHPRRAATAISIVIAVLLTSVAVLVDRLVEPGAPGTALGAGRQRLMLDRGVGPRQGVAAAESRSPSGHGGVLSATYRTGQQVLGGYQGAIRVHNLSTQAVNGWSVIIVLPPLGLAVHDVHNAFAEQADKQVRFTPTPATRVVPAGESMQLTFQVQGVGAPVVCVVEGNPCAGIPG